MPAFTQDKTFFCFLLFLKCSIEILRTEWELCLSCLERYNKKSQSGGEELAAFEKSEDNEEAKAKTRTVSFQPRFLPFLLSELKDPNHVSPFDCSLFYYH